jgi:Sec-independent protein translocase protein TatA
MMTGKLERIAQQMGIVAAVAGLLAAGPCALAARRQQAPQTPGDAKRFATTDEMKQQQREREEEIRDREQEKKEEEQDRADRLQELYDDDARRWTMGSTDRRPRNSRNCTS